MITRIVWTIWTPMSTVPKNAVKHKMICMRDWACTFILIKYKYKYWCFLSRIHLCFNVCVYQRRIQTLVAICRNVNIFYVFTLLSTRTIYLGFIYHQQYIDRHGCHIIIHAYKHYVTYARIHIYPFLNQGTLFWSCLVEAKQHLALISRVWPKYK